MFSPAFGEFAGEGMGNGRPQGLLVLLEGRPGEKDSLAFIVLASQFPTIANLVADLIRSISGEVGYADVQPIAQFLHDTFIACQYHDCSDGVAARLIEMSWTRSTDGWKSGVYEWLACNDLLDRCKRELAGMERVLPVDDGARAMCTQVMHLAWVAACKDARDCLNSRNPRCANQR